MIPFLVLAFTLISENQHIEKIEVSTSVAQGQALEARFDVDLVLDEPIRLQFSKKEIPLSAILFHHLS